MSDLLAHPLWRAEDLGKPLPDSPHATSVCLPTWADNVGYEEGEERVTAKLACGYPRFVLHPLVAAVFDLATRELVLPADERAMVLPWHRSAEAGVAYLARHAGITSSAERWRQGTWAIRVPSAHWRQALDYWQHTGEVISTRQAEALLADRPGDVAAGTPAANEIRRLLAGCYRCEVRDIFLYPSGMAAMAAARRCLDRAHPQRRSLQVGFPYVDVLKIQERFGAGGILLAGGPQAVAGVTELLAREPIAGTVVEVPANPLLTCADLPAIATTVRAQGGLVVVDDTVASPLNVDVFDHADLVMTSLTKYVSGVGDVLAGSLVVSPHSPHAERLRRELSAEDHGLYPDDAVVLADNARDFPARMARIDAGAEILARHLNAHPAVARVHYPSLDPASPIHALRRPGGGCGGLLSLELPDPERRAPQVFDRLRISKGPSLGTNFSLACPFTILAHYRELDWAESHGVSRWLIRVSVGLEDPADLCARFDEALRD